MNFLTVVVQSGLSKVVLFSIACFYLVSPSGMPLAEPTSWNCLGFFLPFRKSVAVRCSVAEGVPAPLPAGGKENNPWRCLVTSRACHRPFQHTLCWGHPRPSLVTGLVLLTIGSDYDQYFFLLPQIPYLFSCSLFLFLFSFLFFLFQLTVLSSTEPMYEIPAVCQYGVCDALPISSWHDRLI